MNYCKDCRYRYSYLPGTDHPECLRYRERKESEDPVHGVTVWYTTEYCELERREGGRCGPNGKDWEPRPKPEQPKPSRWKFWAAP